MTEDDKLGFQTGVLQICLEFWNSNSPLTTYIPDFTKASTTSCQECECMMTEIVSLWDS